MCVCVCVCVLSEYSWRPIIVEWRSGHGLAIKNSRLGKQLFLTVKQFRNSTIIGRGLYTLQHNAEVKSKRYLRGVIDKLVSFFHRIIICGWIYIIFYHYQQQSVVNRKKTLKCKERQTCDVTMTLNTSHVGDVVVKTLEDWCGWCILSGYKCYSTSAIIVKFPDNICT